MSFSEKCRKVLGGLEPDILDYIIGIIEEQSSNDISDLRETIIGFLMSSDFAADEDDANRKCTELFKELEIKDESDRSVSTSPQLLARKTKVDPPPVPPAQPQVQLTTPPLVFKAPLIPSCDEVVQTKRKGKDRTGTISNKASASERANFAAAEIEVELEAARVLAVRARFRDGAYKGAIEASTFTLPNPGGGPPLLEDASFTLVRGRRYGLIGRNGKGKSTMLRALAARRVGDVPPNVTVHYVSQDVQLTDELRDMTPVECVLHADLERRLLMEEADDLQLLAEAGTLDEIGQRRQCEVLESLHTIDAESAPRRATDLLENLGFSAELRSRPLHALSGQAPLQLYLALLSSCNIS
jgi:ATP-binding cassette, subfamily F, member 3